jgi:hypothetical protein
MQTRKVMAGDAVGAVPLSRAAALIMVKYTFAENCRVLRVNYKVKPPSGGSKCFFSSYSASAVHTVQTPPP